MFSNILLRTAIPTISTFFVCFRTIYAVYEMVGTPADTSKADELFNKLDINSDGQISEEEFIDIIMKDHTLLNVLSKKTTDL